MNSPSLSLSNPLSSKFRGMAGTSQAPFSFSSPHAMLAQSPLVQVPANLAGKLTSGLGMQAGTGGPDLRYLVHHATMGYSVLEHAEASTLGWNGYLEQQLDPDSIDDSGVDSVLALLPSLTLTSSELLVAYPEELGEQVVLELQFAYMLRAVYSKRQLFERMVSFWTDHLNVSQLDDFCVWFKTDDDREVVRKHALGSFPEMLRASARSPAMLWYLDNYTNAVGAPQENYARELLELHTLGVDGAYTEDDVKEVARCFTGWTIGGVYSGAQIGDFVFVPEVHDNGPKVVLGVQIPANGGMQDGERVLDILAMHPGTAKFISFKMCRWLLGYEPPAELVRRVAGVYLQTNGSIKDMVRFILNPNVVMSIPLEERTKLRQPLHFVISLMRAALIESNDLLEITFATLKLGQTPYFWPSPDGPPDSLLKWGGAVLPRWEFASNLFDGGLPNNEPSAATLTALMDSAPNGSTLASQISWALTGGQLSAEDESRIQTYISAQPAFTEGVMREAFALAASAPSFQFF